MIETKPSSERPESKGLTSINKALSGILKVVLELQTRDEQLYEEFSAFRQISPP